MNNIFKKYYKIACSTSYFYFFNKAGNLHMKNETNSRALNKK